MSVDTATTTTNAIISGKVRNQTFYSTLKRDSFPGLPATQPPNWKNVCFNDDDDASTTTPLPSSSSSSSSSSSLRFGLKRRGSMPRSNGYLDLRKLDTSL